MGGEGPRALFFFFPFAIRTKKGNTSRGRRVLPFHRASGKSISRFFFPPYWPAGPGGNRGGAPLFLFYSRRATRERRPSQGRLSGRRACSTWRRSFSLFCGARSPEEHTDLLLFFFFFFFLLFPRGRRANEGEQRPATFLFLFPPSILGRQEECNINTFFPPLLSKQNNRAKEAKPSLFLGGVQTRESSPFPSLG